MNLRNHPEALFLAAVLAAWLLIVGLILHDDAGKRDAALAGVEAGNRTRIVFWHAMGGPLGVVMDDLIGRFNKQQDRYFVKSVGMGSYDTLDKKILASIVAHSAPDISQNYETLTKKLIKARKIVCLDDLLASETEDIKADIIPVLLRNNTFDGRLWSFPFNKSVPVLYYNKDLLREAGLDPAAPPTTLDELASISRHLTRFFADGKGSTGRPVIGFGTGKGNIWMFLCRVLQYGGTIVDEVEKKAFFADPPAQKALAVILDMVKEGIAVEGQGFDHQNDFKAQRVAMIENSIVSKVFMEAGIKFDFGVAPLPGAATHAVILSGTNINIFDNGDPDKIQGAWEFVKWFTSTEIGAEWSVRTTYLPVRRSSLNSEYVREAMKRDPNIAPPYVQLDYSYFEPRLTCWFEIRDLMADTLEEASIEKGPPEKYLVPMNEAIERILRHATD
ncbi:MAG: ABC transporter substrate-binding protein [Candidatus Riflebacteria bacterium]|nr:ABC transporter substrate-binding protein [Candidatus Riflebacteria bacterium]